MVAFVKGEPHPLQNFAWLALGKPQAEQEEPMAGKAYPQRLQNTAVSRFPVWQLRQILVISFPEHHCDFHMLEHNHPSVHNCIKPRDIARNSRLAAIPAKNRKPTQIGHGCLAAILILVACPLRSMMRTLLARMAAP